LDDSFLNSITLKNAFDPEIKLIGLCDKKKLYPSMKGGGAFLATMGPKRSQRQTQAIADTNAKKSKSKKATASSKTTSKGHTAKDVVAAAAAATAPVSEIGDRDRTDAAQTNESAAASNANSQNDQFTDEKDKTGSFLTDFSDFLRPHAHFLDDNKDKDTEGVTDCASLHLSMEGENHLASQMLKLDPNQRERIVSKVSGSGSSDHIKSSTPNSTPDSGSNPVTRKRPLPPSAEKGEQASKTQKGAESVEASSEPAKKAKKKNAASATMSTASMDDGASTKKVDAAAKKDGASGMKNDANTKKDGTTAKDGAATPKDSAATPKDGAAAPKVGAAAAKDGAATGNLPVNSKKSPYTVQIYSTIPKNLTRKQIVEIIQKSCPVEANDFELKITRNNDIVVIAQSQHDYNTLLLPDRWRVNQYNLNPGVSKESTYAKQIVIHNLDPEYTEDEIEAELKAQSLQVSQVQRMKSSKAGGRPSFNVKLKVHSKANYDSLMRDGFRAWLTKHRCTDFENSVLCFKCSKGGHYANECKANKETCFKCSGEHAAKDCTATTIKCANCEGSHTANSKVCPYYQQAWALQHQENEAARLRRAGGGAPASYSAAAKAGSQPSPAARQDLLDQRDCAIYLAAVGTIVQALKALEDSSGSMEKEIAKVASAVISDMFAKEIDADSLLLNLLLTSKPPSATSANSSQKASAPNATSNAPSEKKKEKHKKKKRKQTPIAVSNTQSISEFSSSSDDDEESENEEADDESAFDLNHV
jgi:hypothetical protein